MIATEETERSNSGRSMDNLPAASNEIIGTDATNDDAESDAEETDETIEDSEDDNEDEQETTDEEREISSNDKNEQVDATSLILQAVSLKESGNAAFKSGNLTEASRSYRKGTTLLKNLNNQNTGDDQVKSLLLSLQNNLSMICLKQNKPKQSRDIATKALQVDAHNVKALYRRAMAHRKLGDTDNARQDLKLALQYDPDNLDVKRELVSIKKELDERKIMEKNALQKAFSKSGSSLSLYDDKEEQERRRILDKKAKEEAEKEAMKKRKAEWEVENSKRVSCGQEAISFEQWEKEMKEKEDQQKKAAKKAKKEAEKKKLSNKDSSDDDEQLTEKELQMFRGYKKTKDGRTTSYFTRETSSDEAMEIGTMAPQRLSSSTSTGIVSVAPSTLVRSQSSNVDSVKKQGSAWNEAGTWEEKDTSDWCSASLKQFLQQTYMEGTRYLFKVTEVSDLSGDASVAVTRGKKCYVFDYRCKLQYEVVDSADDQVVASGSLSLPDISSTGVCDDLDVEIHGWKKVPKGEHETEVKECRKEFIQNIRKQVNEFVSAFNREF